MERHPDLPGADELRPNAMTTSLMPVLAEPGSRYLNRELSWLDFNARVLALAEDAALPLLERVKFLAIFTQNLDEFFQVRVSGLHEQVDAGVGRVDARRA